MTVFGQSCHVDIEPATQANSASCSLWDGKWVPVKVPRCAAAGSKDNSWINVWMAGKAVWSIVNTCYTEHFRDEYFSYEKALYKYHVFNFFFREFKVDHMTWLRLFQGRFVDRRLWLAHSTQLRPCIYLRLFVEIGQTTAEICQFSIFQDGGYRHLGFSKFQVFNGRSGQEGRTASSGQFFSKSPEPRLRYNNFSIFLIWRPSAILDL